MIGDKKGSILVVTIGFIFVFTLLGFGSLHYAFVQNEVVEKEKASAEAFWLADGALQMAFNKLIADPSDVINKGDYTTTDSDLKKYDVISEKNACPPARCTDLERDADPALPDCTYEDRLKDPYLCTDKDRSKDPALCITRVEDLRDCTQEEKDLNGGLCDCQVVGSCNMLCQCDMDGTCTGRCPCEYTEGEICRGKCPCEIDLTLTCTCEADTCTPGAEEGRCPCEVIGSCCKSWTIQSYGEVNYACVLPDDTDPPCKREFRSILAGAGEDLGGCDLDNALETWGDVNKGEEDEDGNCVAAGSAVIEGGCDQQAEFTFQTVFDQTQAWFKQYAIDTLHYYLNPGNNFEDEVSGITYIEMTGSNKSLNITEDKQVYDADGIPIASLLIIDTTMVDPNKNVMITIAGNGVFRGIVWIIGEAQIVGTSEIEGAIFISGDSNETTKVSGTTDIWYSTDAIKQALGPIFPEGCDGGGWSSAIVLTSWKEIDIDDSDKADY